MVARGGRCYATAHCRTTRVSGTDLVVKFLAEIAFRCFVWLIEKIASSQYAADVADALHSRFERMGAVSAAWSALRALPSAAGSRGQRLANDLGFGALRATTIQLDIFGTFVFFATLFCVYYDAIAKPGFAAIHLLLLRHSSPLPELIAVAVLLTVPLLSFAPTRAWMLRASITVYVGCYASPALFTALGESVRLFYTVADTLAAAGIVLILSSGTTWLLLGVARGLTEAGQEIPRRIIGAACIIVVIARATMFYAHLSASEATLELASGLALRFAVAILTLVFLAVSGQTVTNIWKALRRFRAPPPYYYPGGIFVVADDAYLLRMASLEERRSAVAAEFYRRKSR
jgi:hypothetical protein